jgi:hypothetical protein
MKEPTSSDLKSEDRLSPDLYMFQTKRGLRTNGIRWERLVKICDNCNIKNRLSDVAVPIVGLINIYLQNATWYPERGRTKTRETLPTRGKLKKDLRAVEKSCKKILTILDASSTVGLTLGACAGREANRFGTDLNTSSQRMNTVLASLSFVHVVAGLAASDVSERWRSHGPLSNLRLNELALQLMDLWQRRLGQEPAIWADDGTLKCSDQVKFVQEVFALVGVKKTPVAVRSMLLRLIEDGEFAAFSALVAGGKPQSE